MSNLLPNSRVWSAVDALQTHIICDLRNHARLAARSATSSLSRFVGDITAKFIIVVMNRPGGKRSVSIPPSLLARYGWKHIRCQ